MDCQAARPLISARVDGELAETSEPELDRHLETCTSCQAWEARAFDLRRSISMRQTPVPSELADRVIANLAPPNPGSGQWVRYALGVVAGTMVLLNLPLLLGFSSDLSQHEGRHLGAFGVALGVGLFWAALHPERARGLIPLAAALAGTTMVGALVDVFSGEASALTESSHGLEMVGVFLLWRLPGGRRNPLRRFRPPRSAHRLRPA
jgi:predicted anti-sigma-YlaC factor YlaD